MVISIIVILSYSYQNPKCTQLFVTDLCSCSPIQELRLTTTSHDAQHRGSWRHPVAAPISPPCREPGSSLLLTSAVREKNKSTTVAITNYINQNKSHPASRTKLNSETWTCNPLLRYNCKTVYRLELHLPLVVTNSIQHRTTITTSSYQSFYFYGRHTNW